MSDIARQLRFLEIKKLIDKFVENLNDDGQLLINYLYMYDYDIDYCDGAPPLFNENDIRMFLHSYKTADRIWVSGVDSFRENDKSIKDQVWVYKKTKRKW